MNKKIEDILQEQLDGLLTKRHIKHAVLAVQSLDGSLKCSVAGGIAHPDGSKMTTNTPFEIASITKLFIATSILKLHEEGKLSIDKSVATYLPKELIKGLNQKGGADYAEKITLRNLLEHSSGIPDYLEIRRKGEKSILDIAIEEGDRSWSLSDFLDIVRDVNSPFFEPQPLEKKSKKIRYSDTNFQILLAIIKKVTGKSINKAFSELIYEPLGLQNTFNKSSLPPDSKFRVADIWYKDVPLNIPQAMDSFGDLSSTVDDLIIFMKALITGKIFNDPNTLNIMTKEWNQFGFSLSPISPGWPIEYGLGMMRFKYPKLLNPLNPIPEIIGHTGVTGSWLFYCPSLDIILVGNVSQVTAGALPFQVVPKIIRSLQPSIK